jgi:hypothetical protein
MSMSTLFASITRRLPQIPASMKYEDLFKGPAALPDAAKMPGKLSLSFLAPFEHDQDAYFKDVFAGPVF